MLNLGADLLAENRVEVTPLSRIHHTTLESFLDEYCMSLTGFEKWDDKGNLKPIASSLDDAQFGVNFTTSPVSFKYTFLAPKPAKDNKKEDKDKTESQSQGHGRG